MRLNLRTLLAYLDDTLEPAQVKIIGQKVAENATAQELIARIKEVIRRRRLTTPPATGPDAKLDPNMVAEYIDGTLSPEQLAQVEEVCLGSELYLAEVAACHQILTVLASEPALIPPTARKRMVSLIKGREAVPRRGAPAERAPEDSREATIGADHDEEDETLLLGLPLFLRKGTWLRRLAPLVGIIALAGVIAVAVWQAVPHHPKDRAPAGVQVAQEKTQADEPKTTTESRGEGKGEPKPEPKVEAKVEPKSTPKPEPKVEAKVEPKSTPKPEPKVEPKPESKPEVAEPKTPPIPPPLAPTGARGKMGDYVAGTVPSLLLQRQKENQTWQAVKLEGPVFSNDTLLSLPGYRSEIRLPGGLRLSLWGNLPEGARVFVLESGVVLHDNPAFDLDLTLERGRIALVNIKTEGAARVRVHFQKEVWEISLLGPGCEVAMERWGFYPPGVPFSKEPGAEEPLEGVGIFVLKGQVNIKIRYDTYLIRAAPGRNVYLWDNTGPAQREPQTLAEDRLPSWARKNVPPPAKEIQTSLEALATRLRGKEAVDDILPDTLNDPDSFRRTLGVFSLAASNDLNHLIDALANEKYRDVRVSAIYALQHWIGLRPENDLLLYQKLETKYKSGPAEILMTLLHSYADAQRADPLTYETLIAYLKHDKLAIRELAYARLVFLVPEGAKIPYDPVDVDKRDRGHDEWKRFIPDGKLPPAPKRPPAAPMKK